MSILTITYDKIVNKRLENIIGALSGDQVRVAMSRTLNHEGDKTKTQVRRSIAKQMGLSYSAVSRAVRATPSNRSNLTYVLSGTGRPLNLISFNARQNASGVSAAPWNRRLTFRNSSLPAGSFIAPVNGGRAVFIRESKKRYPIKALYGPGVANEMVRDESLQHLHDLTPRLSHRLGHELLAIIMGYAK